MSLTAAQHLEQYGLTVGAAHEYIMAHLDDPASIFHTALEFGVTSAMLGEITGYSAGTVESFFIEHGLDGTLLHDGSGGGSSSALLPEEFSSLAGVLAMNDATTGVLSTASLRAAAVAEMGQAAYDDIFDPSDLDAAADGSLSPDELGSPHLGTIAATSANIESLFYGTVIHAFQNVSVAEGDEINAFTDANHQAIHDGDAAAIAQYSSLVLNAFIDPAPGEESFFDDSAIAGFVVPYVLEVVAVDEGSLLAGLATFW